MNEAVLKSYKHVIYFSGKIDEIFKEKEEEKNNYSLKE